MYFHLYCKSGYFWRNSHHWQKFYTATGSDGIDKYHLCSHLSQPSDNISNFIWETNPNSRLNWCHKLGRCLNELAHNEQVNSLSMIIWVEDINLKWQSALEPRVGGPFSFNYASLSQKITDPRIIYAFKVWNFLIVYFNWCIIQ